MRSDDGTSLYRHPPLDAAWLAQVTEAAIGPARPIVDPHHHFWARDDQGGRRGADRAAAEPVRGTQSYPILRRVSVAFPDASADRVIAGLDQFTQLMIVRMTVLGVSLHALISGDGGAPSRAQALKISTRTG